MDKEHEEHGMGNSQKLLDLACRAKALHNEMKGIKSRTWDMEKFRDELWSAWESFAADAGMMMVIEKEQGEEEPPAPPPAGIDGTRSLPD